MNGESQHVGSAWEFHPDPNGPSTMAPPTDPTAHDVPEVAWTASEFVAHKKGLGWYGLLALAAAAFAAVAYLLTKDFISVGVIVFVTILFGVAAARQPRVLEYKVTKDGLVVGPKLYPFREFKSFSVIDEGQMSSIYFMPLKRFMPPLSIYYEHKDEENIVQALGQHLPMEQYTHDMLDKFVKKIRF